MIDTRGKFFLGRVYDPAQKQLADKPLLYDPADLTTHAVVTGMTGSGKTGLCITLLEEAALQGIPALLIDPKGDLTNLLLHFPDLAPQDFQPWLDPEMARRAGQTVEQAANQVALNWRNGLNEWGIGRDRLLALKNAARFAVYTPGSDAGIPVSVLSSLQVPEIPWEGNRDILRERIASTVTALLGLVGFDDIDPLRSREHILLSNIFEQAWSQGRGLDLTELILQAQTPPFEKLGAFPVETFFPSKDRMSLALQLNNILAAPAFQIWREGQPLDIPDLLFAPDGRPRHSVFYLAHLSDAERMFFTTLLLTAVETWMRTQAGATSLRALLYFDEIFGYLPPQRNPSSKQPLLRMLKQARAFGLGLLLATQNPVDVDYKALSNAGTWFVGKLQTEQDKARLLDGLQSADGSLDRAAFDRLISALGKRVFIMHNVHEKQPVPFQTRWAMNYLAGPLTRAQVPALNKLVGAAFAPEETPPVAQAAAPVATSSIPDREPAAVPEGFTPIPAPVPVAETAAPSRSREPESLISGSLTRPSIPTGVGEYFLPLNLSLPKAFEAAGQSLPADAQQVGILYRPALVASARVRFLDRKYGVDADAQESSLVRDPDRRGVVRWENYPARLPNIQDMDPAPTPQARFASLDAPLSDARLLANLERDFTDWVFRNSRLKIRANEELGIYATPDVTQAQFIKACADAAREAREAETAKATATYDRQIKTLEDKLTREERELRMDEAELSQRKGEEIATHAENVLGVFGGRKSSRRLSSSLTKRRMTEQAKSDVEESIDAIEQYGQQLDELEQARKQVVQDIHERWTQAVNAITEVALSPKKTDIFMDLFGVAWLPYYLVQTGTGMLELPAYESEN